MKSAGNHLKTEEKIQNKALPVEKTKEDVKELISVVARLTGSFEGLLKEAEPGLSLGQWAALDLLVNGGDRRPFEIAKQLGISRQLAWQTAKKLEKLGLAAVGEPDKQTRAVQIKSSDLGGALIKKLESNFSEVAASLNEKKPNVGIKSVQQALSHMATVFQSRTAPRAE